MVLQIHMFSQVNAVCTRASASLHLLKASLRDSIQMVIDLVTLQIARLSNAKGKNIQSKTPNLKITTHSAASDMKWSVNLVMYRSA